MTYQQTYSSIGKRERRDMLYDFTLYKLEYMAAMEPDGLRSMWYMSLANLYEDGAVTIEWEGGEPVPMALLDAQPIDIIEETKRL